MSMEPRQRKIKDADAFFGVLSNRKNNTVATVHCNNQKPRKKYLAK